MRRCLRWCDYRAICDDCGWECFAKNALGIAAQHHDRTGHTVIVETQGSVTYASEAYYQKWKAEVEAKK